ncbi:ABC transporter ATP-binding protein [Paenibacillus endoradicis]|uniref:ABC transporter ATP-binding protein n=1 Tax=Paenibacillus endoradicis TaxID=2972487 RepID=UPI002158B758|nr:ABC transporter ATP-binding protein [Paenibacillus endoradicis]MCR8659468.1 ABC transporter ATP-binding protein [Paenibacillus endoradicis]
MTSVALEIQGLNKTFHAAESATHVLDGINLTLKKEEFVSIIGPSGCGKSTLLKIIAGLDVDYEGKAELNGVPIQGPSKKKGFIFQEHRLFPWLTVEKNIAADQSLKKPEVRKAVDQMIDLVRLNGFEKAFPKQLSGGMSQRVAIARALLRNPEVLLLDEPFGALDAFTRSHMQESLLDIWRENQTSMLLVTHDIDEAIFLSNRVVVMDARPGKIKAIIPIDLPYPRDRVSLSFQELRAKVLKALNHNDEEEINWHI